MKIPKRFKLMGRTIKVKYEKKIRFRKDWAGSAIYREHKITIQSSSKEFPLSRDDIEQSFLHELTHWILYMGQKDKLNSDEDFVDLFASLLHQAITTMEYDK